MSWDAAVIPGIVLSTHSSAPVVPIEQDLLRSFPVGQFSGHDIGLVKFYTTTAHGSQGINSYLRGAPPFDEMIVRNAEKMQELCFKYELPRVVRVWRGVKNDGYLPRVNMAGQTITNYGFTSASFDQTVPEQFATLTGPVGVGAVRDLAPTQTLPIIFDIQVPPGFPCIVVSALVDDAAAEAEHELILPDGTKFHVYNDSLSIHGMRWISCRAMAPSHDGPLPIAPVQDQPSSRFVSNGATMAVEEQTKTADFDPGEPRDESGKWTTGLSSPPPKLEDTKEDDDKDDKKEDKPAPREGMHHLDDNEREALKARKIVIPPAWTDVQVADDPTSDLQCIGRDGKGRAQYVYSAEHTERQAAAKFERIKKFHDEVHKLDESLVKDSKEDDTAAAVLLMRKMGMRPGSEANTKAAKPARGATNLRVGDVRVTPGGKMKLDFTGKDGVHIVLTVTDPDIKDAIQSRLKDKDKDDRVFSTNEGRAASYMKSKTSGFKLKDLRTYHANDRAAEHVATMAPPKTKAEFAKARNAVGDAVCAHLGNTRTMALNSYINPAIFSSWREKVGI
jgi:DNA topoisomerase I